MYDWNMILRNEFMGIARVNILDLLSSEGATRNLSVPVFLNGKQRGHLTLQIKVISCPGDCSETLYVHALTLSIYASVNKVFFFFLQLLHIAVHLLMQISPSAGCSS